MSVDTNRLAYRKLVGAIAKELTREEIYYVAFLFLDGKGDISKYSVSEQNVCGLELFACLEGLGVFSFKNIDGLLQVVKSLNRNDLVEKIEAYKKKQKKGDNSYEAKCTKKRDSTRSERRQYLEETFELMVTQMVCLEQQLSLLQGTLQENQLDEGMVIAQNSGVIMKQLATTLTKAQKKFATGLSSPSSNSSISSNEDSECSTSVEQPSSCE